MGRKLIVMATRIYSEGEVESRLKAINWIENESLVLRIIGQNR